MDDIFDLSIEDHIRIKLLEEYYLENKDNTIEIISQLGGMYQFSGTKLLEKYLYTIACNSSISNFLKVESVKSLLSFIEFEEDIHEDDEETFKQIKIESNNEIKNRNTLRQNKAYEALDIVCNNLSNDTELSTPYKIDIIRMLMNNDGYNEKSLIYISKIIEDQNINCNYRYKVILSLEKFKHHLEKLLILFSENDDNDILYRILSCQYLLQHFRYYNIENILLTFAENENTEYNLRADSADILLNLGSEQMKIKGREIITKLGNISGKSKTIFDNAQNVHVKEIEKSVMTILEYLSNIPILKIDDEFIDYEYVKNKIIEINNSENIIISLNRIYMDRILYFNNNLSNILVKLWSYISKNENVEEMTKRLIEELEDMSGTCSSGFLSRLINTISGFGEMNITISYEDQIISNFCGRLNAYAQKITKADSCFYNEKYNDILILYKFKDDCDKKDIIEEFSENVINEMTIPSSDYTKRQSFLLFFRTHMSQLREELYKEFVPEFINNSDFDLYFRKALSVYDGVL